MLKDKKGCVGGGRHKANGADVLSEVLVPHKRSLFEAVEGFVEMINMRGCRGVDKPSGLLRIHCLIKVPMKKIILDNQLMDGPRRGSCDDEDGTNSGWFDNGTEGLVEVNT